MQLRQPRQSARLIAAAGALALATVLSSCGFDYATDRPYTPAAGTNDQQAQVDVLGAVVVSAQDGSGTFIASFANNSQQDPATVQSIAGTGDSSSLQVKKFKPIDIEPGGLVNLATEGGPTVTGDFKTGDFVSLEIGFGDGTSVDVDVPVYPPCNEFEGLDTGGASASPSESSSSSTSSSSDPCATESPVGGSLGGE